MKTLEFPSRFTGPVTGSPRGIKSRPRQLSRPTRWFVIVAALGMVGTLPGAIAQVPAQDTSEGGRMSGISVYGTGELRTKPNFVEIDLRASANAEITSDAVVKYRDVKRRLLKAFEDLKMSELVVNERGLTLMPGNTAEAMQMAMRGMPTTDTKTSVEIASTLHLRLGGIRDLPAEQVMETVGQLLDTAQDAGAGIGPSRADINMAWRYGTQANQSIVRFVVRDLAEIRESAYEKAIANAKARAERLARLSGVELGEVVAVNEVFVSGEDMVQTQPYAYYNPQSRTTSEDADFLTSETFAEIPFRVKLLVRFGISGGGEKTARAEGASEVDRTRG